MFESRFISLGGTLGGGDAFDGGGRSAAAFNFSTWQPPTGVGAVTPIVGPPPLIAVRSERLLLL